ncbi:uncharacterized protein LOC142182725 [Nicotiana tabacum]|uniref:Uncharacterized protein LOC142182725 n=1 Tax=Nicotiana tabacum TaxID=4097 RepID=A0AC58UVE5_TOBAC
MDDHELITVFLPAQEPNYFQNMMSAVGKSFLEAIKMGEMVENGLKIGKIISQAVFKAATQAVRVESNNLSSTNEKDEEIIMTTGSRRGPRKTPRRYTQPHQVSHDSPEHYYPPQNTQYSVAPPQYVVQPPKHLRRRARASRNLQQPPQNFQVPYNLYPSQRYKGEQRLKDNFTPIGESYESLFEKLKHYDMISPITPNNVDPRARSFDPSKRCEYHSNAQGHNVESCRDLKREIERMIQENLIVIQDSDIQNIAQNPLPAHHDAHFVGMMPGEMEYENPLGNLLTEVNDVEIGEGSADSDEQICG